MTITKTITNAIYFVGLFAVMILDKNNFQFYYGLVFVTNQIIFIVAYYITTKRSVPSQAFLIKKHSSFTLKDLFLVIPFIIAYFVGINLLFKWFDVTHLVIYIAIGVLSAVLQFLIIRNKNIATFLIDGDQLIINDLFKSTYNLEILTSIEYNEFNDVYIAEFANARKLKIKQDDFKLDDLNKFLSFMIMKSNYNVLLSGDIKNKKTAANKSIASSGAGH